MVAALRHLKLPHGRQPPPDLGVICKGDDHGEFDLRIMPKSFIFLNSALVTAVAHHGGGMHGQRLVDLW